MPENFENLREASYERISPTAWSVAYGRTFSDIPFSKEIFDCLERMRKEKGGEIPGGENGREVAVQFEARYKLTNRILRQGNFKQILEIAAGLAPRGLEFAKDSQVTYVEFDLPEMVAQKRHILTSLRNQGVTKDQANLYLEPGNALSEEDMNRAASHFKKDTPVAVVTEGLLRYLNFKEKAEVAKNVLELLRPRGGIWITPDTQTLGSRPESFKKSNEEFSKIVGRDIESNYFKDESEAKKFFEDRGFRVDVHPLSEIIAELSSPHRFQLTPEQAERKIGYRKLFVMSPAEHP